MHTMHTHIVISKEKKFETRYALIIESNLYVYT